ILDRSGWNSREHHAHHHRSDCRRGSDAPAVGRALGSGAAHRLGLGGDDSGVGTGRCGRFLAGALDPPGSLGDCPAVGAHGHCACVICAAIICQPCGLFWQTSVTRICLGSGPPTVLMTPIRTLVSPKIRTFVSPGVAPANPPGPVRSGMMSSLLSNPPLKVLPMKSSAMIRRNEAVSPLPS